MTSITTTQTVSAIEDALRSAEIDFDRIGRTGIEAVGFQVGATQVLVSDLAETGKVMVEVWSGDEEAGLDYEDGTHFDTTAAAVTWTMGFLA